MVTKNLCNLVVSHPAVKYLFQLVTTYSAVYYKSTRFQSQQYYIFYLRKRIKNKTYYLLYIPRLYYRFIMLPEAAPVALKL